ncbi:MAG TPA: nucleotidyl transferase AbiEii/AbiGii toxin family protein [Candidatus Saccharimonadales bacterium]|nr:nucleotidyl transferase AbiEii/AbiGii toxin family protein [Candidatus Saccharimonadales bacterium]
MTKPVKNVAASLRAKLLEHTRQTKQDFQFVLDRWVGERFLFRLGQSKHREQFVLKGATLFLIWKGQLPRPTRDVDLLGYGSPQVEDVVAVIKEICSLEVNDGIVFQSNEIKGGPIREDAEYQGVRAWVPASLDGARSKLQIDIGFGDAVNPEAEERALPVILDLEPPRLKAYPPEVAIAEKLQAMVYLGMANSRMKDFFDIWVLCREQRFQMSRLRTAIVSTFKRRQTPLPAEPPTALTAVFLKDTSKNNQWNAFLTRIAWSGDKGDLKEIGEVISKFLLPIIEQARADSQEEWEWAPGGPWIPIEPGSIMRFHPPS